MWPAPSSLSLCFVQTINFSCEPIVVEIGKPLCVAKLQIKKTKLFCFIKTAVSDDPEIIKNPPLSRDEQKITVILGSERCTPFFEATRSVRTKSVRDEHEVREKFKPRVFFPKDEERVQWRQKRVLRE